MTSLPSGSNPWHLERHLPLKVRPEASKSYRGPKIFRASLSAISIASRAGVSVIHRRSPPSPLDKAAPVDPFGEQAKPVAVSREDLPHQGLLATEGKCMLRERVFLERLLDWIGDIDFGQERAGAALQRVGDPGHPAWKLAIRQFGHSHRCGIALVRLNSDGSLDYGRNFLFTHRPTRGAQKSYATQLADMLGCKVIELSE
jgi:hypothetical protein